jgi:hypothetical protein
MGGFRFMGNEGGSRTSGMASGAVLVEPSIEQAVRVVLRIPGFRLSPE